MLGEETLVTLHGQGIFGDLSVDLSGDESASVDTSFEVGVGEIVLLDVAYVNSTQVTVIVPPTLALGLHNVRLTTPGREEKVLRDAIEVVAFLSSADAGMRNGDGGMANADAAMAGAPVTTFFDEFDDAQIDPRWSPMMSPSGCTVGENSSHLRFQMDGTSTSRCEVTTTSSYDLRGLATSIEISPITNFHPQMTCYLRIASGAGDYLEYGFNNDELYLSVVEGGAVTRAATTAYDSNIEAWRIRENSGQLYFESSIDLSAWKVEMQHASPFSVANVRVSIGVATSGPMAGGIGIGVDSYNVLP
jgi:hypothetical protein